MTEPRGVLIGVMLLLLPFGLYHRIKSQSTGESLDRRQEGLFILATLRPLGAVFWLSALAWMINPAWMAWSSVSLPNWSRWIGVGFLLTGAALIVWTFRSLGSNLTDTVVTRKKHTLVLHGPYRWIRHPLYSAAGLVIPAVSLIAANWFFFALGTALLCILIVRTRTEEENLVARFGDSYQQYMARTGRFVPRIGARTVGAIVLAALSWQPIAHAQQPSDVPVFDVDAAWPKPLPNNWAVGPVSGIAADARDHIWIIHRREGVKEAGRVPAPPVIEFDPAGNVVQTWGGPGPGYDWPQQVHGITVDDVNGRVWITGNGEKDTQILAFTRAGKFLRQIGRSGMSGGSNNTANVARATQVRVDARAKEIFVSDGEQNQNHRVIVFDSETGAYKRHWGAFGKRPDDAAIGTDSAHTQFGSAVHCVRIDRDDRVYVCDRSNSRFQMFRKDGTYENEVFVAREPANGGTVYDLDFSPDQKFVYVADGVNQRVWILRRDDMRILDSFGERGAGAGQFATSLHDLAVDSKGNIYTGEAAAAGRVQKFVLWPAGQKRDPVRAGNDEWQRIRKSAPYEWEGDIEGIAEWTLSNYGKFLEDFPTHPLVPEAMLKVATAIWARGGYPELFRYIVAPTWEEHQAKTRLLNQWFDTSGFGGGLDRVVKQEPAAAIRAREMFVALAEKYPASESAVMARYFSAVILDYCLNDGPKAVAEYQAFVKRHPTGAPYAEKARRRIAALRR